MQEGKVLQRERDPAVIHAARRLKRVFDPRVLAIALLLPVNSGGMPVSSVENVAISDPRTIHEHADDAARHTLWVADIHANGSSAPDRDRRG